MQIKKIIKHLVKSYRRGGVGSVANQFYNYYTIKSEPLIVKSWPATLIVEPTTNCNLNCIMCDEKLRSRTTKDMTFEQFVKILDQFPYVHKLAIQGVGEPTLNKDFFKMVQYAKEQGIWTYFNTNCTTLTDINIGKMIDASPSEIRLSLDSLEKEVYEEVRKGANFNRVINNIKNFTIAARNTPIEIGLWVVLMTQNVNELTKFVEFCKEHSIKRLFISTPQDWGNEDIKGIINHIRVKDINADIMKNIENKLEQIAKECCVEIIWLTRVSTVFTKKVKRRECQWPWYSTYITVDGFVTPCCGQGSNPNTINFGNVFIEKFEKIWNNKKYIEFRRQLKSNCPPKICIGCPSYTDGGVKLRL